MIDLKQYGYIETESPTGNLIVGRITELQREQYTVITERGEVTAVLKGTFYHNVEVREDFPCVGDFVLLNALMNQEVMTVKAIREDDSRGRHTTTHRQLFMLPSGAMVIDTPGMRELGLFGADEGISAGFYDVEELFTQCRFTDCHHKTEPGCAVLAALADGSLPHEHWERYLAQKQENKFVDDKSGYLRDKRTWYKDLAKWSKQMKKNGGIKK